MADEKNVNATFTGQTTVITEIFHFPFLASHSEERYPSVSKSVGPSRIVTIAAVVTLLQHEIPRDSYF